MNNQGRVQVRDIQGDGRLRPAPVQGDTYAPPPRQGADNRFADLANALQSFSGVLGNMAAQNKQSKAKRDEEAIWAEQKKFSGYTREDYAQAVQSGSIPVYEDEFKAAAVNKIFGDGYGSKRADEVWQHLTTEFDWDNGDPEEYVANIIKEDIETYGADRHFGSSYMRQMQNLQSRMAEYREKRNVEKFQEGQTTAAFTVFDTQVDGLIKAGGSPEEVANKIYSWYPTLGKDGTLGVDYKQLDAELLNKARRMAGTNPEYALAILDAQRKGSDGQTLSLATNRDARDTVLQIRATAAAAIENRAKDSVVAEKSAEADLLFEQGYSQLIPDGDVEYAPGKAITVKGDQLREEAKRRYLEKSAQRSQENRESPDEQLSREMRTLAMNGQTHPQMETYLSGMSRMAAPDLADDPQAREQLLGKLETYDKIARQNQQWAISHTSKEDRYFAEGYRAARDYMGKDKEEALQFAINSSQILTKEGWETISSYRDDIDSQVEKLGSKPSFFGLGTKEISPQNWSVMRQEIVGLAQRFVYTGMKPDKAVETAAEVFKKSHVTYNGVMLNLSGQSIPNDFTGTVDYIFDELSRKQPDLLQLNSVERGDLALRPLVTHGPSDGRFVVVDKDTMFPITDDSGGQIRINLDHIRKTAANTAKAADENAYRTSAEESARRAKGLTQGMGLDGTATFDPTTREIYEFDAKTNTYKKTGKRMRVRPNDDPLYNSN